MLKKAKLQSFRVALSTAMVLLLVAMVLGMAVPVAAASSTFTGSTNDGSIRSEGLNYSDVHAGSDLIINNGDPIFNPFAHIGQERQTRGIFNKYYYYYIHRSFFYFDTSSLPDNAVITGASLKLYGHGDDPSTDFNLTVVNGQPNYPHNSLTDADFSIANYQTAPNGGQFNTSGFNSSGYNTINLNSTGQSWINKTGTTKLGCFQ
jgi:hypothetical protein